MGSPSDLKAAHRVNVNLSRNNGAPKISSSFAMLMPPGTSAGSKRNRRMRSISEGRTNINAGKKGPALNKKEPEESGAETNSKEKDCDPSSIAGNNSIPIFLKKTYKMIDSCDDDIAGWTDSGEMFVVKDPERFAKEIIPQYFDHNKFASFARQLNFYGFRKMQVKPIRNADFDRDTAKHVTFYNEKFKRGRCDLLKEIQRSTRGGANASNFQDQQREIETLQKKVESLEQQLNDLSFRFEERIQGLEFSFLQQLDSLALNLRKHIPTQSSVSNANQQNSQAPQPQNMRQESMSSRQSAVTPQMGSAMMNALRSISMSSQSGLTEGQPQWQSAQQQVNNMNMNLSQQAASIMGMNSNHSFQQNNPTLPPHPKQKQLIMNQNELPVSMRQPPLRGNSLRGISQLRNGSTNSTASGVVMRNSWEDKFFSMLMLGDNDQNKLGNHNMERLIQQASQGGRQGSMGNHNLAQYMQQGQSLIKQEDSQSVFEDAQVHGIFGQSDVMSQLEKKNDVGRKKYPPPIGSSKMARTGTVPDALPSPEVSPSASTTSLSDV